MNRKQKFIAMTLVGSLSFSLFSLSAGVAAADTAVGMSEHFDSLPAGNFSAPNWTPTVTTDGSIRVVADPADPSNQNVRLEKTTTTTTNNLTLDRKNLSVSGKALISYRLRTEETTGTKSAPYLYGASTSNNLISLSLSGANITAYNGTTSSSILTGFQAGKWYNLQFVLDTTTKKYDAYIDGVKRAADFSFRDTTANTDTLKLIRFSIDKAQKGTIQFDDLFVDQLPDALRMEAAYHLSLNSVHASQVSAVFSDHSVDVTDNVNYSSSNPAVAVVDTKGNVTGLTMGTAVIAATFGSLTASTTVTVTPANVLNAVQLDQADYQLGEGQQQMSVLTAVYSAGPIQVNDLPGALFVSSNPSVATVDTNSGLIRALHYGTSVLTATYGDKSAVSTITVLPILQNLVSVSPGSAGMNLTIGGSATSVTQAVYSNGQTYDISALAAYESENPEVAGVDSQGKVMALAPGHTVITVTYGLQSISFPVQVSSLKLDQSSYSLAIGASHKTIVSILGADGSAVDVTSQSMFKVEDASILQVDASGKVSGLRSGTTHVTATFGAAEATATVTVVGDGASADFTLQTDERDSVIQIRVAAGTDTGGNQGIPGSIYAIQTQLNYNQSELQLLEVKPDLFIGTANTISDVDTLYQLGNQPTGYQNVVKSEPGTVTYTATKVGEDVEAPAAGLAGILTLKFQVQHPGTDVQLRVQDMRVAVLNQDQIVQVSPSQVIAQKKEDVTAPVWPAGSQVQADLVSYGQARLNWTAATDEIGVTQYRIYNGSSLIATVAEPVRSYMLTQLQSSMVYSFSVQAGDAYGNWTTDGPGVVVHTLKEREDSSSGPVDAPKMPVKEEKPNPSPSPSVPPVSTKPSEPVGMPFKDVTDSYSWASKAIEILTAKGIIQGTSSTTFEPGKTASRADVITMIVRALGLKADFKENFKDVDPSDYYYQSVGIAKALGIMGGTEEEAMPDQAISRQDLIVMLVRALQAKETLSLQGDVSALLKFQDAAQIAPYARMSMAIMVELGFIQGDEAGLRPQGTASRAEIAVVLARVMDKYELFTKE